MKPLYSILALLTTISVISFSHATEQSVQQAPVSTPVQQALTELNQYVSLQKAANIQNTDLAYSMRKAFLMAELLVQSDGILNVDLRPSIQSAFISTSPLEYEVNMTKVLGQLDASWQPFFDSVKASSDVNSTGNLVVRALFSLASDQAVTDWHAKVAVLAAMLAPYNQGPVGDCFAVTDVIRDHEEYYQHAAEDYSAVVMNGYISRPVNNNPDYFFFLPVLADGDRDQPFNVAHSGNIIGNNVSLLQAPGFAAASSLMGGNAFSDLTSDVMQILISGTTTSNLEVTASQVIAAMAQAISAKVQGSDVAALQSVGEYAFSCLTNNPVLRGVESAFAAMAEDRPNDSTRGNVNSSIAQALQATWARLGGNKATPQFQQTFTSNFNTSYRLLYNLNIPLAQVSADGSSTDGGFQLYMRTTDPNVLGTRMDTPQDLRQLVLNAVNSTAAALSSTSGAQAVAISLTNYIQTDDFLKNVLWDYDDSNKQEADPVGNYLKLSRTPMQSCDGDNPFEVDDIDTGTNYDSSVQTYTPSNARDLITWCLNLSKRISQQFVPMDSPQHAFNFAPANPDLRAFVKSNVNAALWLQKVLITPGMQVASQSISANVMNAIAQQVYASISNAVPNNTYQKLIQSLVKQKLSVRIFAQKLVNGINMLLDSDQAQANEVGLLVDGTVIQGLPANALAILQQSAIRFAFTNWNQGNEDIYFCAYFNPRTCQIGFGTILEDKTGLSPMDETAWVNHQQWDMDPTPLAPKSLSIKTRTVFK